MLALNESTQNYCKRGKQKTDREKFRRESKRQKKERNMDAWMGERNRNRKQSGVSVAKGEP